jgi:hypothetical protein
MKDYWNLYIQGKPVILKQRDDGDIELVLPVLPEGVEKLTIEDKEKIKNFADSIQKYDNLKLASIRFPKGLKILPYLKSYNLNLKEIYIPSSIDFIPRGAFSESIPLGRREDHYLEKVVFEEGGKELDIGLAAFSECENLKEINFPAHLTNITADAFDGCLAIETLDLSKTKLEVIEPRAFLNCVNLKKIILPEGLKEIRRAAFAGCQSLEEVKLPESLEIVGEKAFAKKDRKSKYEKFPGFIKINIPENLKEIEYHAFKYAKISQKLEFKNLKRISYEAFLSSQGIEKDSPYFEYTKHYISLKQGTIFGKPMEPPPIDWDCEYY